MDTYTSPNQPKGYGNYGQAFCSVSVLITYCGYYESDSTSGYYYLQKVGNSWKLY